MIFSSLQHYTISQCTLQCLTTQVFFVFQEFPLLCVICMVFAGKLILTSALLWLDSEHLWRKNLHIFEHSKNIALCSIAYQYMEVLLLAPTKLLLYLLRCYPPNSQMNTTITYIYMLLRTDSKMKTEMTKPRK